jgi:hypothetical protein
MADKASCVAAGLCTIPILGVQAHRVWRHIASKGGERFLFVVVTPVVVIFSIVVLICVVISILTNHYNCYPVLVSHRDLLYPQATCQNLILYGVPVVWEEKRIKTREAARCDSERSSSRRKKWPK